MPKEEAINKSKVLFQTFYIGEESHDTLKQSHTVVAVRLKHIYKYFKPYSRKERMILDIGDI